MKWCDYVLMKMMYLYDMRDEDMMKRFDKQVL